MPHQNLSRPNRDAALFHRLLANASDRINPEFGLEMGWMEAFDCSPLAPIETALPRMTGREQDGAAARDVYASLIDRLVARLGYGAVVRLDPQDCWQPRPHNHLNCPTQKSYLMSPAN